jgi:hypothetical protein
VSSKASKLGTSLYSLQIEQILLGRNRQEYRGWKRVVAHNFGKEYPVERLADLFWNFAIDVPEFKKDIMQLLENRVILDRSSMRVYE